MPSSIAAKRSETFTIFTAAWHKQHYESFRHQKFLQFSPQVLWHLQTIYTLHCIRYRPSFNLGHFFRRSCTFVASNWGFGIASDFGLNLELKSSSGAWNFLVPWVNSIPSASCSCPRLFFSPTSLLFLSVLHFPLLHFLVGWLFVQLL